MMSKKRWMASSNPLDMLRSVGPRAFTDRRALLIGCGCLRQFWHLLTDECSRRMVELTEQFADGDIGYVPVEGCVKDNPNGLAALAVYRPWSDREDDPQSVAARAAVSFARMAQSLQMQGFGQWTVEVIRALASEPFARRSDQKRLASLVRDVFGRRYHRFTLKPAWLTADVVGLARHIYTSHAFDQMPILADALQDAGCDSADVLSHCRGPGPHCRGCWVLERLLDNPLNLVGFFNKSWDQCQQERELRPGVGRGSSPD